jgi:hypothetical protein
MAAHQRHTPLGYSADFLRVMGIRADRGSASMANPSLCDLSASTECMCLPYFLPGLTRRPDGESE